MKCPKCRCEVSNQRICPYCGATVYIQNSSLKYEYDEPIPNAGAGNAFTNKDFDWNLLQKLGNVETKLNLILIFNIATFALVILALIFIALA